MEQIIQLETDAEAMRIYGVQDRNLKRLRDHFQVEISARGRDLHLSGDDDAVRRAAELFETMVRNGKNGGPSPERLIDELSVSKATARATASSARSAVANGGATSSAQASGSSQGNDEERRQVHAEASLSSLLAVGRTEGQRQYLRAIATNDMTICVGPAGTGKTFLAVRMAVEALKTGAAKKLILCRPAVEAGESLGFLPGDFQAKVNPYLRPLYDALHCMLEYEQIRRYTDREIIEIVPLAYMRGRTLNNAFIILDEGQNTLPTQMKMFLTRMGERSKVVITGDTTQVDLPAGQLSGLVHARRVLSGVAGIEWCVLTRADIVRHPLVADIVNAYERFEQNADTSGGRGA